MAQKIVDEILLDINQTGSNYAWTKFMWTKNCWTNGLRTILHWTKCYWTKYLWKNSTTPVVGHGKYYNLSADRVCT